MLSIINIYQKNTRRLEGKDMKGKERKKRIASLPIITIITLIVIMFFTPTTLGDGEIGVSFDPRPNEPPNAPSNPDPANGEEDVPIPATLEVYVYDETSSTVDVYFYNASDDSLIGVDNDVPAESGGTATVVWTGLEKLTGYSWYAVANDSEYENTSDTWSFVTRPNQAPEADAGGPYSGKVRYNIVFDGSGSSDSDGNVVGYRWDFTNDGSWDTDWLSSATTTHNYSSTGTYTVKLQVKDDDNATDTDTAAVTISVNTPPVAEAGGPYSGKVNRSINFDGSGSVDPDGSIVRYRWDFTNDGLFDTDWSSKKTAIHSYSSTGTYTVKLQVKDNNGATDTDTASVIVSENSGPTARAGGPYTGVVNVLMKFDGSSSYDPDGSIVGYRWDFTNDDIWDTDWLSLANTTHTYSSIGTYTVKLQVKDDDGETDEDTTTVNVLLSMPPVADANGPYYGVVGEEIEFNGSGSYDPDGTIISYLWDFGDNQTSDMTNPVHSYLAPGSYTVTLKVTDNTNISDTDITTAYIQDNETEEPDESDEEKQLPLSIQAVITVSIIIALAAVFAIVKRH